MVLKPGTGSFGTVCRCQVLLENEICISIKWSAAGSMKCSKNFLVYGCVDLGPQKTQWTNTSRWHGSPTHHWLWKLYTGPQATWILCLSSLPPDSGTLISKGNAKFTFIREHNFGPLSSSPVLFVLAQARRFWRCLLFKSGLTQGMRQLKPMSCIRLCVVVLGPAAVHSLWISPHFWMGLFHNPSPGCGYPYCLYTFFYHIFPSLRLSINVLGHSSVNSQPLLQWPFVSCPPCARLSMVVFWTTVKSAVFPMIV